MSLSQKIFSATATEVNLWKEFVQFQYNFNKEYQSLEEHDRRFDIFKHNFQEILSHNSIHSANFTLGVNQFTDLTHEEFKQLHLGYNTVVQQTTSCSKFAPTGASVPTSVDWRAKNAVTPVKDQGQCGSCWSFSATGAMEGAWAIAKGSLISLSEQQLVDCSRKYGNLGCNGGLMDSAFEYSIDNGACSESEYPYTATGGTCHTCRKVVQITKCSDVQANNQVALKEAVAKGPVSIAIEADTAIFQSYKSGVITSASCGTNLDHGVLIVGYGVQDNIKYWLVKNSWSASWGDAGYVKIERSDSTNDKGICGVAMQASFPVV
jgi:C1A family cysteine protease